MRVFVPIETEEDLVLALSLGSRVLPYRYGHHLLCETDAEPRQSNAIAASAAVVSVIEPLKAA